MFSATLVVRDLEGDSDRANHVICSLAWSLFLTTNDYLLTMLMSASGTGKLRRYGVDGRCSILFSFVDCLTSH